MHEIYNLGVWPKSPQLCIQQISRESGEYMTFQVIACNSINQLYYVLHFNSSACVMNLKKIRKWMQIIDLLDTSFTSNELKFQCVKKYCTCYWSGSEAEKFHPCKSYFFKWKPRNYLTSKIYLILVFELSQQKRKLEASREGITTEFSLAIYCY